MNYEEILSLSQKLFNYLFSPKVVTESFEDEETGEMVNVDRIHWYEQKILLPQRLEIALSAARVPVALQGLSEEELWSLYRECSFTEVFGYDPILKELAFRGDVEALRLLKEGPDESEEEVYNVAYTLSASEENLKKILDVFEGARDEWCKKMEAPELYIPFSKVLKALGNDSGCEGNILNYRMHYGPDSEATLVVECETESPDVLEEALMQFCQELKISREIKEANCL